MDQKPKEESRWSFRGMTVRDWLELLIVPLVLVGIGLLFEMQQAGRQQATEQQQQALEERRAEVERELAEQTSQDEALQAYLDQISQLILEKELLEAEEGDPAYTLAQARTSTVILRLDAMHNASVLRFLSDSGLGTSDEASVGILKEIVVVGADLNGVDLSELNLSEANLSEANLSNAYLGGANLSDAYLRDANLSEADFYKVDLSNADFSDADLFGANLTEVGLFRNDLSDAFLSEANLTDAHLLSTDLGDADLSKADLSGVSLNDTNLNEADLSKADLSGCMSIGQSWRSYTGRRRSRTPWPDLRQTPGSCFETFWEPVAQPSRCRPVDHLSS